MSPLCNAIEQGLCTEPASRGRSEGEIRTAVYQLSELNIDQRQEYWLLSFLFSHLLDPAHIPTHCSHGKQLRLTKFLK